MKNDTPEYCTVREIIIKSNLQEIIFQDNFIDISIYKKHIFHLGDPPSQGMERVKHAARDMNIKNSDIT